MTRTNQEIFDTCLTHLRAQGRRSIDPISGFCVYRGPDGLKCAIGALIPNLSDLDSAAEQVARDFNLCFTT